jgi:ParB-like nuclease domain
MPAVPEVIAQQYDPAVPVDTLEEWPDNPNQGDVGHLSESLDALGFYGAIIVQTSTRRVIGGNHRLQTALARDMPTLPVIWADVDDDTAERMLTMDNEATRRGVWDEMLLVEMLTRKAHSPKGLAGTGFDGNDLDDLMQSLNPPDLEKLTGGAGGNDDADAGEDLWPSISLKLSPDDRERFYRLTETARDRSDAGRLIHLLDQAETEEEDPDAGIA